jgi:hypothetical protein
MRAPAIEMAADTAARAMVAASIVEEVRDRIGQEDQLPPPLAQATQDQREKLGYAPDETLLRTEALRDSYHWEHASTRVTEAGSDSPVALYQELGTTRGVPARYPLTRTVSENDERLFGLYFATFGRLFRL